MPNHLPSPKPASQPRQGLGARFVRRFGGAVRGMVAGITRLRRPAAPPSSPIAQPEADQQAATAPLPPPRLGRKPRWFRRGRRLPFEQFGDAPFTPEAYPGLSPEACAFLNTPLEDCDPETLSRVLEVLAYFITDNLPPEAGMTDPQALFATLWGRLGPLADAAPSCAPPEQPDAASDSPVADAPNAMPTEPPEEMAGAAIEAAPDAPPLSVDQPSEPPAPAEPDRSGLRRAETPYVTLASAAWPTPRQRRRRPPRRHERRPFRHGRSVCRRTAPARQRSLPPLRRLYYAACAGPP